MVKIRLARLLKSIRSANGRKNLSIFFLCLFLSTIFWLFIKLSRQNVLEYNYSVNIENTPPDLQLTPYNEPTVNVKYNTTGAKFLFSGIIVKAGNIKLDFSNFDFRHEADTNFYFVTSNKIRKALSQRLDLDMDILSVSPDTLFYIGNSVVEKKCPVVIKNDLKFSAGYKLFGDIIIEPDSVLVRLPENEAEKIQNVAVNIPGNKPLDKNMEYKLPLKIENSDIVYYDIIPDSVNIEIPIEKYTEFEFEVPLNVLCEDKLFKNNEYSSLKLLPGRVKISGLVALKDFSDIRAEDFVLVVDCKEFNNENRAARLTVIVHEVPDKVSVNEIFPRKVDYILLK